MEPKRGNCLPVFIAGKKALAAWTCWFWPGFCRPFWGQVNAFSGSQPFAFPGPYVPAEKAKTHAVLAVFCNKISILTFILNVVSIT